MTGPEHYHVAERLLSAASHWSGDPAASSDRSSAEPVNIVAHDALVAEAQVHATLALAAATVQQQINLDGQSTEHWAQVTA